MREYIKKNPYYAISMSMSMSMSSSYMPYYMLLVSLINIFSLANYSNKHIFRVPVLLYLPMHKNIRQPQVSFWQC
jgi:hypothetical protein